MLIEKRIRCYKFAAITAACSAEIYIVLKFTSHFELILIGAAIGLGCALSVETLNKVAKIESELATFKKQ